MNLIEYSYDSINQTITFLQNPNYLWFDYTFNVTQLISGSIAQFSQTCSLASIEIAESVIQWLMSFGSVTNWVLSFLQNMLGNVIAFQKIYDLINTDLATGNIADAYYQFGRIANLLLVFEPVVTATPETEQLAAALETLGEMFSLP
jgi:hypothetical protein